jgi:hypothetical protein
MKITGSNIQTLNKSSLTKDLQIEHQGALVEIKSTKRGLAITCNYNNRIILNGDQIIITEEETQGFEKTIKEKKGES